MAKLHKFVGCDPDLCTGCTVCEYVCSLEKEGVFNPLRSRIRAVRVYPSGNLSITCMMCEDAPCVIACPRDALQQSEEDGHIIVDEDKCNGCGWCVEACDFGAITINPDGIAIACDLCDGEPECIEACPVEALSLQTRETTARKSRIAATTARITAAEASEAEQ
ncbi:MAG: 4Fe-4S dicluster domain-containing protein [Promethearchaeia archaeon]